MIPWAFRTYRKYLPLEGWSLERSPWRDQITTWDRHLSHFSLLLPCGTRFCSSNMRHSLPVYKLRTNTATRTRLPNMGPTNLLLFLSWGISRLELVHTWSWLITNTSFRITNTSFPAPAQEYISHTQKAGEALHPLHTTSLRSSYTEGVQW